MPDKPDLISPGYIPPYANESARYFGVSNECVDPAHPYGTHLHGLTRYVRWAPEETQKISEQLRQIPKG